MKMVTKGLIKEILSKSYPCAEKNAFSLYDGENIVHISYSQFAKDVLSATGYFNEKNIHGQHIALIAPNSYKWMVAFFALIASRNVAVPMNPDLSADILQWQCEKADISMVCSDNEENSVVCNHLPMICLDNLHGETPASLEGLYEHDHDEVAIMLFTSGTTGKSKVVMLSLGNFCNCISNKDCAREGQGVELFCLPFYHIGPIRKILIQLYHQAGVAIGRGTKYVFMDMVKLNPSQITTVPTVAESLVKLTRRATPEKMRNYIGDKFEAMMVVGASLKPEISKALMDRGVKIYIQYGMTETVGDGTWGAADEKHIGSIGKSNEGVSIRLEEGEILVKSPGVMKGYYKDPEETAKVIVDGWLHTGDLARYDEDGYLYICGRKKNVIILSNGENVNPEEIEATFGNCEAIEECMVYSDGKGICADIFTKNPDTVKTFVKAYNETMPMYRQVYKVNYMDEPLPKTGSGKIQRKQNL